MRLSYRVDPDTGDVRLDGAEHSISAAALGLEGPLVYRCGLHGRYEVPWVLGHTTWRDPWSITTRLVQELAAATAATSTKCLERRLIRQRTAETLKQFSPFADTLAGASPTAVLLTRPARFCYSVAAALDLHAALPRLAALSPALMTLVSQRTSAYYDAASGRAVAVPLDQQAPPGAVPIQRRSSPVGTGRVSATVYAVRCPDHGWEMARLSSTVAVTRFDMFIRFVTDLGAALAASTSSTCEEVSLRIDRLRQGLRAVTWRMDPASLYAATARALRAATDPAGDLMLAALLDERRP